MNEIDNMTLQCLTNKNQYDMLLKRNSTNIDNTYLSDKRFYKKRILDLTKKCFKNEVDDNHVKSTFESYIRTCINYLKFSDKKELYQEQYNGIINIENKTHGDNIVDVEYDNCDFLMYKKEDIKTLNLDTFVTNKGKVGKAKILPQKSNVNIKSSEYKTKGIVKKKKNITNNYEDPKEKK